MIHYMTPKIEIGGRHGHLGSIRAVNLWQFRRSIASAKEGVANVASLSYGMEAAKNPETLVARLLNAKPVIHGGPFEFVPVKLGNHPLPTDSLRGLIRRGENPWLPDGYSGDIANEGSRSNPAVGFIVECPVLVARQWLRHRSFAYNEMSRRYVLNTKVPFEFWGQEEAGAIELEVYLKALEAYEHLLATGETPEEARRVIPVGMMTKFWVGGYLLDWKDSYLRQRWDVHAQLEIRTYAEIIAAVCETRQALEWIGPETDEEVGPLTITQVSTGLLEYKE